MITIYNFQAGFGDTFLVQVKAEKAEPVNLLIDCGYEFERNALPLLKTIGASGRINRFIITHFDDDHIFSACKFIEDYKKAETRSIDIDQIWLNTFRHLPFTDTEPSKMTDLDRLELMRTKAYVAEYSSRITPFKEGKVGARRASLLGSEILKAGIDWNSDFDGKSVSVGNRKEIPISENVTISLLTPNQSHLRALKSKFIADLKKLGIQASKNVYLDDAFELYTRWLESEAKKKEGTISGSSNEMSIDRLKKLKTEYTYKPDTAVGNGSSITFMLNAENKQLLFLADAHAEDIIDVLTSRFPNCESTPVIFDAIKVAHHGSFKNNKPTLHEIVDSAVYIFSTNGQHPTHVHPDVETIAQIINRPLPSDTKYRRLYFNYQLDHLAFLNDPEFQSEFHFQVFYDQSFNI